MAYQVANAALIRHEELQETLERHMLVRVSDLLTFSHWTVIVWIH